MIAIHHRENSYSERWMDYCRTKNIEFIIVNIYDSNIITVLLNSKVKFLLVHLSHNDFRTALVAKPILLSIEKTGIIVYPNLNTFWPFDDKVSQKYIFEALKIPHGRMEIFYNEDEAFRWLTNKEFPFVFKLRDGAGSSNVSLIKNNKDAIRLLRKMFKSGIKPLRPVYNDLSTKIHIHSTKRDWIGTFKRLPSVVKNILDINKQMPRQKGYFLAQEFLPNNSFDTRIVIVGNRAFPFRRFTRPNDFRASGSKDIDLDQDVIDKRALQLSFDAANKIGSQSMAFDILFNSEKDPVIIEMSCYCPVETIFRIKGFWDSSLIFHNEPCRLEDAILTDLLS